MSQEQPRRPQASQEPIKYGDVFNVSGDLAKKPVAPQDAAMMQSAECQALGHTQRGGVAAAMQSAANRNEQAGLVGHRDVTDVTSDHGATVIEAQVPGSCIVTELVGGQVVGQYAEPVPVQPVRGGSARGAEKTIGEALEAAAQKAGDKPVEQSDAAAIQAAEMRATGSNVITPSGQAAMAQSAAAYNAGCQRNEDKIKLADVLAGATAKLSTDRPVTHQDAEGVVSAETRNNSNVSAAPGGVAESVSAAARMNENVNV